MKIFRTLILTACTAIVPVRAEEATSPSPPEAPAADPFLVLDHEQVQQAISILRRDHVRGARIDEDALGRATLRGLLENLAPGASLAA